MKKLEELLSPLIYLSNNWLSLAGVVTVTSATVFWLFLLPSSLQGEISHPYLGILAYLILPGIFFAGLLLIPLGLWMERRRELRRGSYPVNFPPLDFQHAGFRRLLSFIALATFVNIVIASQLSYKAVTYMDSVSFCGQTCHTVMQPEFAAHRNSPHSRVECVSCHIGAGAGWFVRSKLSGVGQVLAVALNTYPRPIPTPVHNLRPARETCETCHWPQKYGGDKLRILEKFSADETNTRSRTVLLMHVGKIHRAHLREGVTVRYAHTDEKRQSIAWVEHRDAEARLTRYSTPGAAAEGAVREMDCLDCHTRPTHAYDLPDRAVDNAMATAAISPTLPFAKKMGVEILKARNGPEVAAAFEAFYKDSQPAAYAARRPEVERSAQALLAIYNRNVFPEMKVTWGTYIDNIGHTDFPGCFRCHDGARATPQGKKLEQDCNSCHNLLAMEEAAPKILTDLGVAP